MKLYFSLFAMSAIVPIVAVASSGTVLKEQQAVLADQEIQSLLKVVESSRHLTCGQLSPSDVVIQSSAAGQPDTFDASFGCNDPQGANVQRIDFSGSVFSSGGISVDLGTMQIEESE